MNLTGTINLEENVIFSPAPIDLLLQIFVYMPLLETDLKAGWKPLFELVFSCKYCCVHREVYH